MFKTSAALQKKIAKPFVSGSVVVSIVSEAQLFLAFRLLFPVCQETKQYHRICSNVKSFQSSLERLEKLCHSALCFVNLYL